MAIRITVRTKDFGDYTSSVMHMDEKALVELREKIRKGDWSWFYILIENSQSKNEVFFSPEILREREICRNLAGELMNILNLFQNKTPEPPHFKRMISDGAKMTRCGWCGKETPVWMPMDYFGFSATHCHWCRRPVDEYYRDWVLREEWECGCVHAEFASGSNYQSYSNKHYYKTHQGEKPHKVFTRSKEDAIASSPRVIMYPDRGGYTGISISPSEARMYTFGRLLKHIKYVQDIDKVFDNWKPFMDKFLKKYDALQEEPGRTGTHIDEILDSSMLEELKPLMGR